MAIEDGPPDESKEIIAVAGVGNLGKYICEELLASQDFAPIILTRNVSLVLVCSPLPSNLPSFFLLMPTSEGSLTLETQSSHTFATTLRIPHYRTSYTTASLTSILDHTGATTLISFVSPVPPSASPLEYSPLHSCMLAACQRSRVCKRFIPAEWGGHTDSHRAKGRWFGETRGKFRESLKAQREVQWTGVGIGWLGDYFLPTPTFACDDDCEEENGKEGRPRAKQGGMWEEKTHMPPALEMWPIDVRGWEACIRGTGDEKQSWILGRDVGRAVVQLCKAREWVGRYAQLTVLFPGLAV